MVLFAVIATAPSPFQKLETKTSALSIQPTTSKKVEAKIVEAPKLETTKPVEPKPFDANDASTWPVCPENQIVWAQDGICHEKAVEAAPVAQAVAYVAPVQAAAPQVAASSGNCGDNPYKQYIYQHESGCQTDRWNSSGCYGLGQACPASKVKDSCGADFACQDAWFTNYAIQRYGSWQGAYNFWVNNHWW